MSEANSPTEYWLERLSLKEKILSKNTSALENFRNNGLTRGIDLGYTYTRTLSPEETASGYEKLFPSGVSPTLKPITEDSPLGNPSRCLINDVPVTLASLRYAYITQTLLSYIGSDAVVWEIGSGYGGQARALLKTGRVKSYISQDFPLHIKLQKYFLQEFSQVTFLKANASPDKPVDLVINCNSFQEMELHEVNNYFSIIHNFLVPAGYFYHCNSNKVLKVNQYPFDQKWRLLLDKAFPRCSSGTGLGKEKLYQRTA